VGRRRGRRLLRSSLRLQSLWLLRLRLRLRLRLLLLLRLLRRLLLLLLLLLLMLLLARVPDDIDWATEMEMADGDAALQRAYDVVAAELFVIEGRCSTC
jgi:hypothetical protein